MVTREEFAQAVLRRMRKPWFYTNKRAMVTWMQSEGSAAKFNPLATTKRMPGSTDFNSIGVQNYPDLQTGVEATVLTLQESGKGYEKIRRRLALCAPALYTVRAIGNSEWGTSLLLLEEVLPSVKRHYEFYASKYIGQ